MVYHQRLGCTRVHFMFHTQSGNVTKWEHYEPLLTETFFRRLAKQCKCVLHFGYHLISTFDFQT